jgi:hypothetical protein
VVSWRALAPETNWNKAKAADMALKKGKSITEQGRCVDFIALSGQKLAWALMMAQLPPQE